MPIAWHKECLKNMEKTLQQKEAELVRVAADVKRLRVEIQIYELQIQDALAKQRSSFDQDTFGKKKERKV